MKHFMVGEDSSKFLENLVEFLNLCRKEDNVGGIGIFLGIVRGLTNKGEKVKHLDFEVYKEKVEESFAKIAKEVIDRHKVINVFINHVSGRVKVGDLIMVVAVAGRSRREVFPALIETVEKVKKEAPIWKKETLENGISYWVEYK